MDCTRFSTDLEGGYYQCCVLKVSSPLEALVCASSVVWITGNTKTILV